MRNIKMNELKAFTLAEVLVTLGIIGVISAMTIPTLVQNHQSKVLVTQLHKVYNEFSQAAEAYITSSNAVNLFEAGVRSQDGVAGFVQSNLNTVKNCGSTFTDCFASSYRNMDGGNTTNYDASSSTCYALSSGASVCLKHMDAGAINMVVDVNGKQGPNIIGRDLFAMGIDNFGNVIAAPADIVKYCDPYSMMGGSPEANKAEYEKCLAENNATDLQKCKRSSSIDNNDSLYCFAQILNDSWKMEY